MLANKENTDILLDCQLNFIDNSCFQYACYSFHVFIRVYCHIHYRVIQKNSTVLQVNHAPFIHFFCLYYKNSSNH